MEFRATEKSLFVFQTAALLEVVNAALGLVKSSVMITAFQVASRLFLIWGVLFPVPQTQTSLGYLLILTAWTVTEVIRYT